MNLIDRYVTEVGKYLPRKNRLDIEAELRSTLEDMLEDRVQQVEGQTDEALVEELLQEYGSPKEVAATYQTHQYLIGPSLFNIYTLVLKIVLAALTLGLTIATAISLFGESMTTPELLKSLGGFATSLIGALIAAFGNVTLVFAILERVLPASEFEDDEEWTPAELTKEPDANRVGTGETIAGIVFTTAALIILNFYPQIVGIWNMVNGEWAQTAGLSEAFFRYLPWINLSGILTIALNIWLLRQGIWGTLTRWLHIGLEIVGIVIAVAMLRGPSLLSFYNTAVDTEVGGILATIFNIMIPVILIIVIVVSTIEVVKDILRMARSNKTMYPFEKGSN
jgi:hypothetical protein